MQLRAAGHFAAARHGELEGRSSVVVKETQLHCQLRKPELVESHALPGCSCTARTFDARLWIWASTLSSSSSTCTM